MPKKIRKKNKIVIGHEEDGTPIVKWASGYTKKELAQSVERLRREYVTGYTEATRDEVFRVYAQRYYNTYRRETISDSQRVNLASAMNKHILPYIGEKRMVAVGAMDLQEIMNALTGRGKTLIGDVYSLLTSAFSHAYANGVIERDPSVGLVMPKAKDTEKKRALTDEESKAILHLATTHESGLLLLMLYYLGLRRGEALGGRWEDVDFRNAEYHVVRDIDYTVNGVDSLKTESSKRTLPIPDELMEAFKAIRGLPGTFILQATRGGFWPKSTYDRRWDDIRVRLSEHSPSIESAPVRSINREKEKAEAQQAKREGRAPQPIELVYGSILTAGYLRHNYASILYDAGVEVLLAQKLMGHADPSTTMRIYTHLKERRERVQGSIVQAAFNRERDAIR